jgi:hypothetical protein
MSDLGLGENNHISGSDLKLSGMPDAVTEKNNCKNPQLSRFPGSNFFFFFFLKIQVFALKI